MWEGQWDDKMKELFIAYDNMFGCLPDTYEEIVYYAMSYDEFCDYIKTCLAEKKEIPYVVQ